MDILSPQELAKLTPIVQAIKPRLNEWQLVQIRVDKQSSEKITASKVAQIVANTFSHKGGCIFICNPTELIMLLHTGLEYPPHRVMHDVQANLPPGSCDVVVEAPILDGFNKIELVIKQAAEQPTKVKPAEYRATRVQNVVLVADDDTFIQLNFARMLGKNFPIPLALKTVSDGNTVLRAYQETIPDILFLDIHLPGRSGLQIIKDILAFDPNAFVVVVSADNTRENADAAIQYGAKGFLTKPFTVERILSCVEGCKTIT